LGLAKYVRKSVWALASGDYSQANTAEDMNLNVATFAEDIGGGGLFHFRAFLHSDGTKQVELDSISVEFSLTGPAVLVTETDGSTNIYEEEGSDAYEVVLNSQPTSDVTINMNTGANVHVDPQFLTFTPDDWDVSQTVTVTALVGSAGGGDASYVISHIATSEDPLYDGRAVPSVVANVTAPVIEERTVEIESGEEEPKEDDLEEAAAGVAGENGAPSSGCSLIIR